ncbi:MAG: hypothetical protein ACREHG_09840 [Candidatus Saccharimonadales bacterium]
MSDTNWLAKEMEAENQKNPHRSFYIKISLVSLMIILAGGLVIAFHHSPTQNTASSAPITDTGNSADTPNTTTNPITTPTPNDSSALSQEVAEDKAMAAQDEANAKDDISSAQSLSEPISVPSFSIPTTTGTVTIPSYSYTPPTSTPSPSCAYGSQIASSTQTLIQTENKLSTDEQASQTSEMPDGEQSGGVTAFQHDAAWASALQADENSVNSAQNTLSNYESQPGCS